MKEEGSIPRSEKFGHLTTADHKVLNEGSESRNNQRYAVVVQDLATQWIQSYLCKTQEFAGDGEESTKISGAVTKPKVIETDNSQDFGKPSKTKYACIVEADEPTRKRLEGCLHKYYEDYNARKRINSLNHYNLVHKFVPMLQSNENTRCESSGGQRMGKTRENTSMATDGSQKQ